jgi:hypothetical protein
MTQSSGFDFTKFVPGFDFLKHLAPGAGAGSAPAPGWVAPTLDPEELEKRIQELKTVHFWLEQNTKAVAATIQALEVQRMTLSTLKGMNLSFHELAESLKVNAQASAAPFASASAPAAPAAPQEESPAPQAAQTTGKSRKAKDTAAAVDPAQWWGALTDQFQHIAHKAMKDMAHSANAHAGTRAASAKAAAATSKPAAKTATKPAAKKAARKSARPAARQTSSKASR